MKLEILYEDEDLVAINKPHGLLVDTSKIANDATEFALQILRDQINQKVYPAHRLDRKTSGVLLFSKNKEADRFIQHQFMNHTISKTYLAIVRGFINEGGTIDYPIGEAEKKKKASTAYEALETFEIQIPLGKHATSRYSLLEIVPKTGRFHQIRKHMAHIRHPIIGDRPHGCSKQNRMWKEKFDMEKMMLHAKQLEFCAPNQTIIKIIAPPSSEFERVLSILKLN